MSSSVSGSVGSRGRATPPCAVSPPQSVLASPGRHGRVGAGGRVHLTPREESPLRRRAAANLSLTTHQFYF